MTWHLSSELLPLQPLRAPGIGVQLPQRMRLTHHHHGNRHSKFARLLLTMSLLTLFNLTLHFFHMTVQEYKLKTIKH